MTDIDARVKMAVKIMCGENCLCDDGPVPIFSRCNRRWEDAKNIIAAYEASLWQPIETAPKGVPILLFAKCKTYTAYIRVIGWSLPDGSWVELCFGPNRPIGVIPTKWQPLPAPPKGD